MNLNVCYASDNNYSKYLGISVISLLENNKLFKNITVYIIDLDISFENKIKIESITNNYNRQVVFIKFPNEISEIDELASKYIVYPKATYARLILLRLLPNNLDKILYLDCDTIVADGLTDLWETEIDKFGVGGVFDIMPIWKKKRNNLSENYYVNAGILLINLKYWRESNAEQKFFEIIKDKSYYFQNCDQDIINIAFKKSIKIIDLKYNLTTHYLDFKNYCQYYKICKKINSNYYSAEQFNTALAIPSIIHYAGRRPWFSNYYCPRKNDYIKYLKLSPWHNEALEKYDYRKNLLNYFIINIPKFLYYRMQLIINFFSKNFSFDAFINKK